MFIGQPCFSEENHVYLLRVYKILKTWIIWYHISVRCKLNKLCVFQLKQRNVPRSVAMVLLRLFTTNEQCSRCSDEITGPGFDSASLAKIINTKGKDDLCNNNSPSIREQSYMCLNTTKSIRTRRSKRLRWGKEQINLGFFRIFYSTYNQPQENNNVDEFWENHF